MLVEKKGSPEKGELVKGKVKKILPQCAFLELENYKGHKKAVLHVSEVSDKWTEDIKEEIAKEDELICEVIEVNEEIELSRRRVDKEEKRRKEREDKLEKRAEEILKAAAERGKMDKEEIKKIERKIYDKSHSLYGYIELGKEKGFEVFEEVGASQELIENLKKAFKERKKEAIVKEKIEVTSFNSKGVKGIKDLLTRSKDIEVSYLGAPNYLIKLKALDYKKGQNKLDKFLRNIKEAGEEMGVQVKKIASK